MKMGLYAKYVLPRLIDLAMRNEDTARLRAECLPLARGDVLEIGIGSGLNLRFYSPEVRHAYGVDPSVELQRMAAEIALVSARAGGLPLWRRLRPSLPSPSRFRISRIAQAFA
jgi:hypothetical protein